MHARLCLWHCSKCRSESCAGQLEVCGGKLWESGQRQRAVREIVVEFGEWEEK